MSKTNINGEVRMSLEDYHKLLNAEDDAQKIIDTNKQAVHMLGDFLQFLKTKSYFNDICEEFNGSHNRLSIGVKDGRALLYIDGEKLND